MDEAWVHRLLEQQHPDLAHLPIRHVAAGWDNFIFRLGAHWAVRLPRREASASLTAQEQQWLPQVAALLPVAAPVPTRIGLPGEGFPWRWSIVPWLP
ncbi:MAG: phosphotransferase, partial [Betaproteobacteria bacterium]|nr:phosphotransferase [Betaproteobacteria bacterium]